MLRLNGMVQGLSYEHPELFIPTGLYLCHKRPTEKFKYKYEGLPENIVWEVLEVPKREGILFHWGNNIKDTTGCILTGDAVGELLGWRSVINSKIAFRNFMTITKDINNMMLNIVELI